MTRIPASVVEAALRMSADPLAADLLARLEREHAGQTPAKTTRAFPRQTALRMYREKAARGDRPTFRTDGYPSLLAALDAAPEAEVIVHGVTFGDTVYLVLTDAQRSRCVGVLRKQRLHSEA
jgi:hypothetical protein